MGCGQKKVLLLRGAHTDDGVGALFITVLGTNVVVVVVVEALAASVSSVESSPPLEPLSRSTGAIVVLVAGFSSLMLVLSTKMGGGGAGLG